jgi:threonine synthase
MTKRLLEGLRFRCTRCRSALPATARDWRCPECGDALALDGMPSFERESVDRSESSIWRYSPHVPPRDRVTLGEGWTPLIAAGRSKGAVLYKLEYLNPTGSFKDRGMSFLSTFLSAMKVGTVVEDSSGNAGASLATYAARANIHATIYVPSYTSPHKLSQISASGMECVSVPGPRADAARAVETAARAGAYYASHFWNPFALEGLKTFAYEVVEQLGWKCPDRVIFPCGHGTLLLGSYYGFETLRQAGVIETVPQLYCIQAAACAPIAEAFATQSDTVPAIRAGETVAEGIRIAEPARGREILSALRRAYDGHGRGRTGSPHRRRALQA